MYTENLNSALGMFEDILDELARAAKTNNGKGGVGFSFSPIDGKPQIVKIGSSKPCTCSCKSKGLKFKDILDDIDQVIFNDPATIVTFKDGSKVCVKACEKDTFTKEAGLMYALVKRLYANDIDDNGYLKSRGLGEKINKVIEGAFDQKKAEADKRAKQRAKAKAKEAKKAELDTKEAKEQLANEVSEQAAKEAVDQVYSDKSDANSAK